MNILVIDGMGGGMGKAIIEQIKKELTDTEITAVGTNSIATSAMIKAGANYGATEENVVIFNSAKADFIRKSGLIPRSLLRSKESHHGSIWY